MAPPFACGRPRRNRRAAPPPLTREPPLRYKRGRGTTVPSPFSPIPSGGPPLLPRTLEPESMDSPAEAMAYDEMDHQAVNEQFVADLLSFQALTEGELLDLGTGTARIPIALCRRIEEVRIVAADLSLAMLDVARINLEIAGLIDRILLVHGDVKQFAWDDDRFTAVISNSLLHHLADPRPALEQAVRLTAGDGILFFRDLLRPASETQLEQLVSVYAGNESDHARQLFRQSLHAALSLDEIRHLVEQLGFEADTVHASSDRHWTWAARKPVRTP